VAQALTQAAQASEIQFVLSVGDNFYENGVANVTDPQWQTTYEQVYTDASLQVPWYIAMGNHDHDFGRGQAEIDYYTQKMDNRWMCPAFYYNQVLALPNGQTMEIVIIDTWLLDPTPNEKYLEHLAITDEHNSRAALEYFRAHDKHRIKALGDAQIAWLSQTLNASTANWLFVAGHYPVYSGGANGNTQELITDVLPLMVAANVDAYMSGHDHCLQHLQSNGMDFWLSGSGSKESGYTPIPQSLWGDEERGFMISAIDTVANTMQTTVYDKHYSELYVFTQNRKIKRFESK
jgi:tartrate-resistant acid phosphatase type 5